MNEPFRTNFSIDGGIKSTKAGTKWADLSIESNRISPFPHRFNHGRDIIFTNEEIVWNVGAVESCGLVARNEGGRRIYCPDLGPAIKLYDRPNRKAALSKPEYDQPADCDIWFQIVWAESKIARAANFP